nr:hypothetical protein [Tanacetum cinerariifolium]
AVGKCTSSGNSFALTVAKYTSSGIFITGSFTNLMKGLDEMVLGDASVLVTEGFLFRTSSKEKSRFEQEEEEHHCIIIPPCSCLIFDSQEGCLGDLDEIEEVNANCIFMANLQHASTSGTQLDKAPVYDINGLARVKENQEKDKIGSKPDKNGKRGEAGKSQKPLQLKEEEKPKKTKKEWPKTHTRIESY